MKEQMNEVELMNIFNIVNMDFSFQKLIYTQCKILNSKM